MSGLSRTDLGEGGPDLQQLTAEEEAFKFCELIRFLF